MDSGKAFQPLRRFMTSQHFPIDAQSQIDIIFLDFEKAFDHVSQPTLKIKTIETIVNNDLLLAWIEAYLYGRTQCVRFDIVCSDHVPVKPGIPQGSVLGPLFFLIFINDIVTARQWFERSAQGKEEDDVALIVDAIATASVPRLCLRIKSP